jgi:hypothetical protein
MLLLVGAASAADIGNQVPAKSDDHVLMNPVSDREGGETVNDATPIPGLPYNDTGATCDNVHDYDEVCPYSNSFSPDVVYSFTPAADIAIDVDLCGSLYDTKTYIYDTSFNVIACNDDAYFGDPCGLYVSLIENAGLMGGQTYYIVIDGYGSDCGEYLLEVRENVPCILDCSGVEYFEGEPDLGPGYLDAWNGGCNSPEFGNPFQALHGWGDNTLYMCGESGWYDDGFRDTDWFEIYVAEDGPGYIECNLDAEQNTYMFELGPQDCNSVGVLQSAAVGPCSPGDMTIFATPGSIVWFWIGPTSFYPPDGFQGNEYVWILTVEGVWPGPVAAEAATWSSVKSMFK